MNNEIRRRKKKCLSIIPFARRSMCFEYRELISKKMLSTFDTDRKWTDFLVYYILFNYYKY